jgi:hypothetical protein
MAKIVSAAAKRKRCLEKFLYYFPGGYQGKKYISWEREYKWNAHILWKEHLHKKQFKALLDDQDYAEIARLATWIEGKTNLLFSFEKMAIRDAVKTDDGAMRFANGLYDFLYRKNALKARFNQWTEAIRHLPRKQTRVLTWPLQTVFGFIADPSQHIFLKPMVTKRAAEKFGFDFKYRSEPNWETYQGLLDFGNLVAVETKKYKPRDMIDLQSFIWVLGSDEYPD